MDSAVETRRVTLTGAAVNTCLAAAKMLGGLLAHSQALFADGIHSLSDLVTDGMVLVGSHYWNAEPDARHPYGHGRIETIISIVIGITLAVVSIAVMWRALVTITLAHDDGSPGWLALTVALVSIGAKESLYRWTRATGKKIGSRALAANAWHHRSDALSSVPVAVAVVGSHVLPSFTYLDHIAAIIVGVMLLTAAWKISKPCIEEIMEARCDEDIPGVVEDLARKYPEIREAHDIRCRHVGTSIYVEFHMLVDAGMSVGRSHELTDILKYAMMNRFENIQDVTIHVEPS